MGPYTHQIDPVIVSVAGFHLWWYGLSYSLGFLNAHVFLRRNRARLGFSVREIYGLTLFLVGGVLAGGRSLVVFNNEWSFYREHLTLIPAIWLGGLATHGLILGGGAGVICWCLIHRKPIRPVLDVLAVAAALIMGCGRIGNFIDGQIVGRVTDLPWAVQFPEAAGFRHPVVLYDGLKNFLLIPVLLWVRHRGVRPGQLAALFMFLYPALRIPIDLLREYPITLWGLPTGQTFNLLMALGGAIAVALSFGRASEKGTVPVFTRPPEKGDSPFSHRLAFAVCLAIALVIPSDATRDIPSKYGRRHPGLHYSILYPRVIDRATRDENLSRPSNHVTAES
jgi:phosphatidylglycerol:prolipoprotein diacylglycerol transferase